MDVADKVISGVVAFAFIGAAVPIAFGFLNDGNWTLAVGDKTYNMAPLIILIAIVFVLGLVYLVYKSQK
jgi:cytochrome c biogenesis factor